jgi:hypothetical protein
LSVDHLETPRPGAEEIVGSTQDIRATSHFGDVDPLRFVKRCKMAPSELQVDGVAGGRGKTLDLKVIGLNCGTSVDGIDCVHVHYTQEHPDAPLKMELLNYDEGISLPFLCILLLALSSNFLGSSDC